MEKILNKIYDKFGPILFFDIETTGLDVVNDDILQLYVAIYDKNGFREFSSEFGTNKIIPEGAFAKHGITNERVKGLKTFKERVEEIWELFDNNYTLGGYNHIKFDIPFIIEQFMSNGIVKGGNLIKNKTLDVLKIYQKIYPSDLSSVYKRLTNEDIKDAHNAKADIYATSKVLEVLMDNFNVEADSTDCIDIGGFFKVVDNRVTFAKGKNKDKAIGDVTKEVAIGFMNWIKSKGDISPHTKSIAEDYIKRLEK